MATRIHPTALCSPDQVGEDTEIGTYCVIDKSAIIGRGASISHGVTIAANTNIGDRVIIGAGARIGAGCVVGNKVTIGANAVINDGINLQLGSYISANTNVFMPVPPYAIVEGPGASITGYVDADPGVLPIITQAPVHNTQQSRVKGVRCYEIRHFPDLRGDLTVGEFTSDLPFSPKRYFLVYNVASEKIRGEHAHKKCHQFLICTHGRCSVIADDGSNRQEFLLDHPGIGVHIPPMIWGIQYKFTRDAVLLVFASETYDSDDYIRNYDAFLKAKSVQ
jgi:UDP-2-acetamido-3-amino-2,3-dideoxy-glucuronate N-acetyltransferase